MTLRHMKIFVSVFRHSNVTRAADELHLAQPSVSFAIKELEDYYGIRLFERIGKRITEDIEYVLSVAVFCVEQISIVLQQI